MMIQIDKVQNKLERFFSSFQTVDDLETAKFMFSQKIEAEIKRRKEKHYSNFKFNYEVHRSIVKIEDLVAEDYFPYDFKIRGYLFFTESAPVYGSSTSTETTYNLFPVAFPVDADAFARLANRCIKDKDRSTSQKYIDAIRNWCLNDNDVLQAPYGEDEAEYRQGIADLLRAIALTYSEPIKIYGPTALENFKPKEIWVGVVDGKLHYTTKETPRFLKLWKNIRNHEIT